ncbi:glycoside hydrolase family 127 protein [Halosimplex aquaticum]|uniref:Glycoside hydrolase family 127 protein n=1 Tax=Halosimplex aquaticum TaxID=3026162 RepID=A0ABD5Y4G9_9EURY|nr:beta-L-arabinofuranosidase domain-containing protein [Halosimplex aquaticum]
MTVPQYSVDVDEVEIDDEFWSPWIRRNRTETIEYQYEQLEESGSLENFRRVIDGKEGGFSGMWFQDSDAYKWIEAASYELAKADDPDLRERVDEVIDLVARAQRDDGYVNTYFQLVEPDKRWTNLNMLHELYCGGHLIEAAVAHYRATGDRTLLDVGIGFADHVDDVFGDEIDGVPGHEEIELALIKLYRVTGEERYLDRATYFVDRRGHDDRLAWEFEHLDEVAGHEYNDGDGAAEGAKVVFLDDDGEYDGRYAQDHAPVREQDTVEGHSVRAMYLFAAVTDLVEETGDEELWAAMERLWENMTKKRMYVTGGIGPAHEHEGFTEDYDLPNETAYAETCAAIGSIFWNQRLLDRTGEAKYADLIERTLYNGFLAGVGLDGKRFFYVNPLASSGDHHRKGWFTCACCPPNAARLFASLGQYLYSKRDGELYVDQFVGSRLDTTVDGVDVTVEQSSSLPWDPEATLEIDADGRVPVNVRIPEWATDATIEIDGDEVDVDGDGFVRLDREWDGETVAVTLDRETELVAAHPAVEDDAGRVAVERAPLVYAAEAVDNDRPLHQYAVPTGADAEATHDPSLLEGVTTLEMDATVPDLDGWEGSLYRSASETGSEAADLTLVPYYAWDNRDAGDMQVWHRSDLP